MALIETPTPHAPQPAEVSTTRPAGRRRPRGWLNLVVLLLGALVFLFPFYYMVVGSLQAKPDTSLRGAFPTGGLTLHNYAEINSRVDLGSSLINSGIFTGGVILGTVVFGVLAGYALARLKFRGRGVLFASMLLVQIVPFQLLMIPLYVIIARDSRGFEQPRIGRHAIACVENDEIAANELFSVDSCIEAVASHSRVGARLASQRIERATRLPLGSEADRSVNHEHDEDRNCFGGIAGGP